jgi:hypothetical protein
VLAAQFTVLYLFYCTLRQAAWLILNKNYGPRGQQMIHKGDLILLEITDNSCQE